MAVPLAILFSSLLHASGASLCTCAKDSPKKDDQPFQWRLSGKLKTGDTYYGKNIKLLNNCHPEDRVFYIKSTLDVNGDMAYLNLVRSRFSLRSKATWGSAEVIPTTTTPTKTLDSVGRDHKHHFPRHVLWMREAWLEFSLNESLGLKSLEKKQTLTLGAFPFSLGRGIALGDAYAVSPNYLGFYSDTAVDQYAFGIKLSGDIVDNRLSYDLYGAILDNRSNSLSKTGKKIRGQEYDKLTRQERGFGIINYVIAGRLNINAVDDKKHGKLNCEPYFLFNNDPEQTVEFRADAESKLGTIGFASEYTSDRFEFGFDTALNFGRQRVKGWDRNHIQPQNRNGGVELVNSHVYVNVDPLSDNAANITNWDAYKVPHISTGVKITAPNAGRISGVGSASRKLINGAPRDEVNNGKSIGTVISYDKDPNNPAAAETTSSLSDLTTLPELITGANQNQLFNAKDRFRNPYENRYKGWMFVADIATFFSDRDFQIAGTVAYASGDHDPNFVLKDCDYRGFIGLQELYAGKRVKSAFFLGSAGKVSRPLDIPETRRQPNRFSAVVSGFTNLALIGAGLTYEPKDWKKRFSINPNILLFWQPNPDKAFDLLTKSDLSQSSRSFLGVEFNLFFKKELMKNLTLFGITSVFVPGSHYEDVRGKPMNAEQWKILDRFDVTGYGEDMAPGLGTNISYTFNFGFEYKF